MPASPLSSQRHFRLQDDFLPETGKYQLLPFRFISLDEEQYVLTNFVGEYCVVERDSLQALVAKTLRPGSAAYSALKSRHFFFEAGETSALHLLATKYRTKQAPLAEFTSLHMIVPTLRCNTSCIYCQASHKGASTASCDMTEATADRAIDFMFCSPSSHLKLEFQGGEPLLNFDMVRYIVERARRREQETGRNVSMVICSNLALISESILQFCEKNNVHFSTSLDGPRDLHNHNRPSAEFDSYERARLGIARVREALGVGAISALMTTTQASLSRPKEIVDEYLGQGFASIFLRPINPYGFASKAGALTYYSIHDWIEFYKMALDYIIDLNIRGIRFREEYAALLLRRMLSPYGTGYVDLQSPAGIGISGILFNHDGNVYASDESRMLGEMGDPHFRLGNLLQDSYKDMMLSDVLIESLRDTMTEGVPGCSDCGFQPYCGSDPVRHYRQQGDIVGFKPTSEFCQRHMALFRHIIGILESGSAAADVLRGWIY
jgi:His-Xaa-Ser system radical SAM maturase HxsB